MTRRLSLSNRGQARVVSTLITLPFELLELIVDYVDQIRDARERVATLAALCMACQRLRTFAQPRLDRLRSYDREYRTYSFVDGGEVAALAETLNQPAEEITSSISKAYRFIEPELATWTHNFRLTLDPDSDPFSRIEDISPFLHHFKNLKSLCLEDPFGEGVIAKLPRRYDLFPFLEQFILTASYPLKNTMNHISVDFLMCFFCSPRLQICAIEEVRLETSQTKLDWPVQLSSLEYLRFFHVEFDPGVLETFLEVHQPRRLSIRAIEDTPLLRMFLSQASSFLTELQIEFMYSIQSSWMHPDFTSFSHLRRLALDPRNLDDLMKGDHDIAEGVKGRFIPRTKFPPFLERLDMAVDTSWIHRLRFMELLENMVQNKARVFPNLSSLYLYFTTGRAWSHRLISVQEQTARGMSYGDGYASNGETVEIIRLREACMDANVELVVKEYPKWDFLHSWWSTLEVQPTWRALEQ